MRKLKSLLILILLLSETNCFLDRSGTGTGIILSVEPRLFCPGDAVTISWDYTGVPRSLDNCEYPTGGFAAHLTCRTNTDCPAPGANCIDGGCCAVGIPHNECGNANQPNGCYPDLGLTITADTFSLSPPQDGAAPSVRGHREVTPPDSTLFSIEAGYNPPPRALPTFTAQTTMVRPEPETYFAVHFPFQCVGSMATYPMISIGRATEHVTVTGVRNTTRHIIALRSNLSSRAITLNPGELTNAFNGVVAEEWIVNLSPLDTASGRRPRCEATNITDPLPDLSIDILLRCRAS